MAFKARRQARYKALKNEFFTGAEAQVLSEFRFKQSYIRQIRLDRRELVKDARELGLSKNETLLTLRSWIDRVYAINGWQDTYAMMRDYRQRAIDRGEYIPPPKKPRKPIDKGDVVVQKKRYRARKKAKAVGEVVFDEASGRYVAKLYE
tara:strand:+ start:4042 stop:4488 length:447 start_codon:yes stop_codon:yes gene_type:complete